MNPVTFAISCLCLLCAVSAKPKEGHVSVKFYHSRDCTGSTIGGQHFTRLNTTSHRAITSSSSKQDGIWAGGWDYCHTIVWDPTTGFAVQLRCNDDNTGRVEVNAGERWCAFSPRATYNQATSWDYSTCHLTEEIQWSIFGLTYVVPANYSFRFTDVSCKDKPQDNICFSRESSYACRVSDPSVGAEVAYAQCFLGEGEAPGEARHAQRVLMSSLVAGDRVLSEPHTVARVVVTQHSRLAGEASNILTLRHAHGEVSLTPDHMLLLDSEFKPARAARVGARVSSGAVVESIIFSTGGVVNPITTTGKILAAGETGLPSVAATGNEWLADVLLSPYAQYTLSYSLAALFPQHVQAYYDLALEPFFNAAVPSLAKLKETLPPALVAAAFVVGDALLAAGLGVFSLGWKGVATLAAVAAMRRASARK